MSIVNKTKEKLQKRGFTLLETLVAIFILVLSITGPMVFAQNGLRASFQSRDQITAFFLAQDVLEYVKNVRDTNSLAGNSWLNGLDSCVSSTCSIDTRPDITGNAITSCAGGRCSPLNLETTGEFPFFGHSGDPSRYIRTIKIEEIVPNVEAQVLIEIQWDNNVLTGRKRIVVQENIYNWIPTGN